MIFVLSMTVCEGGGCGGVGGGGGGGWGGVFFFQAEDGIRDLVRSRGLGDVYKRQVHHPPVVQFPLGAPVGAEGGDAAGHLGHHLRDGAHLAVSYTHLTLPTSDLV